MDTRVKDDQGHMNWNAVEVEDMNQLSSLFGERDLSSGHKVSHFTVQRYQGAWGGVG